MLNVAILVCSSAISRKDAMIQNQKKTQQDNLRAKSPANESVQLSAQTTTNHNMHFRSEKTTRQRSLFGVANRDTQTGAWRLHQASPSCKRPRLQPLFPRFGKLHAARKRQMTGLTGIPPQTRASATFPVRPKCVACQCSAAWPCVMLLKRRGMLGDWERSDSVNGYGQLEESCFDARMLHVVVGCNAALVRLCARKVWIPSLRLRKSSEEKVTRCDALTLISFPAPRS